MAKPPSPGRVLQILNSLNWQGHVELSDNDLNWLSLQISAALDRRRDICESCGELREVLVPTRLGVVCEECLDEYQDQAENMREAMRSR